MDAIVDRERIGPFDIYVPINQTVIAGQSGADDVFEYIQAEQIPRWVKTAWTRALKQASGAAGIDEVELSQVYRSEDNVSTGLIDDCQLEGHADRWLDKFVHLIRTSDISADDVAWEHEQRTRSTLSERLKDVNGAAVTFGPPNDATTHIDELWACAKSYVLIAADELPDDLVSRLLAATSGSTACNPYLIIVRLDGTGTEPIRAAKKLDPDRKLLAPRAGYCISPPVCIVDGVKARFAPPEVLLSNQPVLQVDGWTPTSELTVAIDEGEGGSFVRELLDSSVPRRVPNCKEPIHKVIEKLQEFASKISAVRDVLWKRKLIDEDDSTDELNANPPVQGRKPTILFDPELRQQSEDLQPILGEIAHENALLLPLQPENLTDSIRELFDRAAREGLRARLDIFMNEANGFWETSGVLAIIKQTLRDGAKIRIICCPRNVGTEADLRVREMALRISEHSVHQITVAVSRKFVPPAISFQAGDLALVAIGSPGGNTEGQICFAIRSLRLVEELQAALEA